MNLLPLFAVILLTGPVNHAPVPTLQGHVPSPSIRRIYGADQGARQSEKNDDVPHGYQSNSKDSPVFVQQTYALKTDEETEEDQRESLETAQEKSVGRLFNWLLIIVGILQASVMGFQCWILKRQTGIISKQADTADKTLVAAFHPKLIVRGIFLKPGKATEEESDSEKNWRIKFNVANTGGSSSTITRMSCGGYKCRMGELPPRLPDKTLLQGPIGLRLNPGESQSMLIQLAKEVGHSLWFWNGLGKEVPNKEVLYFIGRIRFADKYGVKRNYGFCRLYDIETGRFTVVNDPYYEYSD